MFLKLLTLSKKLTILDNFDILLFYIRNWLRSNCNNTVGSAVYVYCMYKRDVCKGMNSYRRFA